MTTTVIMPVFNRERYVGTAIRSLLRHRPEVDLDILVIDDGSTDGSRDVVRRLQEEEGGIRLIRQENAGVTAARNTGLRNLLPETRFVSFLDSDDVSTEGRYATDLALFAGDPSLGMVYSRMTLVNDIDPQTFSVAKGAVCATVRGISLSTGTYSRELVEAVGLFDTQLTVGEDLDFLLRIFERGTPHVLCDHVSVLYRRHEANMTADTEALRRGVMRAMLKSAQRRKNDPSLLRSIPPFLDVAEMEKMRGLM